MAIPNLLDPRMLSQVGVPPPLQQSITPVSLPAPAPAPPAPMTPPPMLPAGLGLDALGAGPMPQAPAAAPRRPSPNFTQILMQSIPLLVAGIAASRGGPGAMTGLLGGYVDAMEKRRLIEEKQHEFDVQTAASDEDRQMRREQYALVRQEKVGAFLTSITAALDKIDDPATYAKTVKLFDVAGQKWSGLPAGFIESQLGTAFDTTKATAKAQKDAEGVMTRAATKYGDQLDELIAGGATMPGPDGKVRPLSEWAALAGAAQAIGPDGRPVKATPKPKNEFEQNQADLKAAIQAKQDELKRPLTPEEIRALSNTLRGEAAAAVRAPVTPTSLQHFAGMYNGVLTEMMVDPKTGRATPMLDAAGKPVPAPPTQTIINMGAQEKFNQQEFTADRPDPVTANKMDALTGLTPNAQYQGGITWALTGLMPSLGQSNSGQMGRARDAIINKGSAVAAAAGVDIPTLRAEYKAKAPALANLTTFYTRTAAAAGSAEDALQLAEQQSALVPRGQTPIANTFTQWLATGNKALESDPNLAALQLYIYTAVREYAKVTGGGAGSVAALTDYASQKADELLSAAQSPETFAKVAEGMRNDMRVTTSNQLKQIDKTSSEIANFLSGATGFAMVGPKTAPTETPGTGRQTGAGPAGGPPSTRQEVTINGLTVTGPTGVPKTYKTLEQAQAAYSALKALK